MYVGCIGEVVVICTSQQELEAVEQAVKEADVKAIEQSALVDETAPKEEAPAASNTEEPVAKSAVAAEATLTVPTRSHTQTDIETPRASSDD